MTNLNNTTEGKKRQVLLLDARYYGYDPEEWVDVDEPIVKGIFENYMSLIGSVEDVKELQFTSKPLSIEVRFKNYRKSPIVFYDVNGTWGQPTSFR